MSQIYILDPGDKLDYKFDWEDWLGTGETISTYTVTVQTGLTKVSDSKTDTLVTVWLSGGTARTIYSVTCQVTTNAGRVKSWTGYVRVQDT